MFSLVLQKYLTPIIEQNNKSILTEQRGHVSKQNVVGMSKQNCTREIGKRSVFWRAPVKGVINIDDAMRVEKVKTSGQSEAGNLNAQRKGVQELFHTRKDHALNPNFGVKFVESFIFTGTHIAKMGSTTK